jgi:hypothetical protein
VDNLVSCARNKHVFRCNQKWPPARWSSRTAKPVMRWPEKDAAWQDVALGIREVVKWRKPDLKAEPFFGRIAT